MQLHDLKPAAGAHRKSRRIGRGTGAIDRKLTVEAHAFSSSAREAIEARGGTVNVIGVPRKIGPRRLAAKTAKRAPKAEEAEPVASPPSAESGPKARVGKAEQPVAEQSTPTED